MSKTAIIIGAGPAGLTAAYELLIRTDIVPLVIEMSDAIGGISRTVKYKSNRIDIGKDRQDKLPASREFSQAAAS